MFGKERVWGVQGAPLDIGKMGPKEQQEQSPMRGSLSAEGSGLERSLWRPLSQRSERGQDPKLSVLCATQMAFLKIQNLLFN